MNFNPHDYQDYAIRYIEKHPVAAVLLDMGLGKTIISLTAVYDLLFDSFDVHRVLVVAPLRVARDTWPAEIQKWEHLRGLTYAVAVGTPKERKAALMQQADITISMKSTDHLKMPELVSTEYEVQLSDSERSRYEDLKQELILQLPDGEVTAANAASLTGKLSQLANGAIYADTGEVIEFHDRKLDALEDIIEAANEKPFLVAYWFRHDLSRIKNRFNVREIKTSRDIADWNAGKIPVAVIHPASAGHGLNLQAGGSTLVWFGLTWSLELYQQTNARLWRQGQESGTVVIQHIITKGTIDERIVKALSKKEMTQTALIDAVKADLEVV